MKTVRVNYFREETDGNVYRGVASIVTNKRYDQFRWELWIGMSKPVVEIRGFGGDKYPADYLGLDIEGLIFSIVGQQKRHGFVEVKSTEEMKEYHLIQ